MHHSPDNRIVSRFCCIAVGIVHPDTFLHNRLDPASVEPVEIPSLHPTPHTPTPQQVAQQRRLLYRSKQRGWLELDLVVGLWAKKHIPTMSPRELDEYETFLTTENPDLFKYLTGQVEAPDDMKSNGAFVAIKRHVDETFMLKRNEAAKTDAGVTWRRGWDDGSRKPIGFQ